MVGVEDEHHASPFASCTVSSFRISRPRRKISPNSGSSLNEPVIFAIQPCFEGTEVIFFFNSAISCSRTASLSSTVIFHLQHSLYRRLSLDHADRPHP